MASVSVYHATVYAFTQEGVDDVTKLFDNEVVDVNVRCSYYSEIHIFRIQCPIDTVDTTYSKFAIICGNYIREHSDDEHNPKFTHMRETALHADSDLDFERLMAEDGDEPLIQFSTPEEESDDEDNPTWRPKDARTDVTKIFTESVLEMLTDDVVCNLGLNVERACIVFYETSSDVIQLVSRRLDNIERNAHRNKITIHFLRPEKDRNVYMVLRSLVDIPDNMLLHTLAPEEYSHMLPQMRRVRMMRPNRDIVSVLAPVSVPCQDLLATWNSLALPQLNGFESTAHRLESTEADKPSLQQGIDLWARNIIPDPLADDTVLIGFEPLIPEAVSTLPSVADGLDLGFPDSYEDEDYQIDHDMEQPPLALAFRKQGRVQSHQEELLIPGLEDLETPITDDAQVPVEVPVAAEEAHVCDEVPVADKDHMLEGAPQSLPETIQPAWENTWVTGTTNVGNLIDLGTNHSTLSVRSTPHRNTPSAHATLMKENLQARRAAVVTSGAKKTTKSFGNCQTPVAPSNSQSPTVSADLQLSSSSLLPTEVSEEKQEDELVERVKTETDKDDDFVRSFLPGTYHRKGKGKGKTPISVAASNLELPQWLPARLAGSSGPSSRSPSSESMKSQSRDSVPKALELPEFSRGLMRILDEARAFKGKLETKVQIGRILLSGFRHDQAKDFATSVVNPSRMTSGLQRHTDAEEVQIQFTRRLTTSTLEACLLPVPHLFEQEPVSSTAWYEFHCEDIKHNLVLVKVSGDGSDVETALAAEPLGQVFLHFPKRQWDANFVVQGQKQYSITRAISHLVGSVSAILSESAGDNLEELHRIVDMRFRNSKELRVVHVFGKRRCSHRCKKNDRIILHVIETQNLDCAGFLQHLQDRALWGLASTARSHMIESQALWFEAELETSAHPSFEQNLGLHFGDDADWKPEEVMDEELLCDIQAVVDQMVTRIDGVGVTNEGLRGDREDLEEMEAERKRKELDKLRGGNAYL